MPNQEHSGNRPFRTKQMVLPHHLIQKIRSKTIGKRTGGRAREQTACFVFGPANHRSVP